jgi:hypothetical protein
MLVQMCVQACAHACIMSNKQWEFENTRSYAYFMFIHGVKIIVIFIIWVTLTTTSSFRSLLVQPGYCNSNGERGLHGIAAGNDSTKAIVTYNLLLPMFTNDKVKPQSCRLSSRLQSVQQSQCWHPVIAYKSQTISCATQLYNTFNKQNSYNMNESEHIFLFLLHARINVCTCMCARVYNEHETKKVWESILLCLFHVHTWHQNESVL